MHPTPVICGPTAGGKSDLALALARIVRASPEGREKWPGGAAILAADAFQVYRGLDIASAKPTPAERETCEHLLIDLVEPSEPFTASQWLTLATRAIRECQAAGRLPIVVGGTHLYIKLLVDGMFEGPAADEAMRERLRQRGLASLREELERVDPAAAARIHPNDERRTIRALEVFELTGRPISEHQQQWETPLGTSALRAERTTSWLDPTIVHDHILSKGMNSLRPVGFVPRDPYPPGTHGPAADLIRTNRFLPHLELPEATYFVTWKTLGDLPLSEKERTIVLNALLHFDEQKCRTYAACVMSNHVHWIVQPCEGAGLHELISSVKRFSARSINAGRHDRGSVWSPECFDHIIRDAAYFAEFVAYVLANPVEAGVARRAGDYRWSRVHADVMGSSLGSESRGTQYLLTVLDWPTETINRRINARVKIMMERGMLEETRRLASALGPTAREALGTKQLLEHLRGACTLEEAVERVKIETRRFAKNQRTWLKRLRARRDAITLDASDAAIDPVSLLAVPPVERWAATVFARLTAGAGSR